jgi:hypothetical protein
MSSPRKDHNDSSVSIVTILKESFGAASMAGLIETTTFHPFDTMSKRLQKNVGPLRVDGETLGQGFARVALRVTPESTMPQVMGGLYSGLGWGLGYKFFQRGFKIGLQKPLQKEIQHAYGDEFESLFGKRANVVTQGIAGMILGVGEIALLPLDAYKIKSQTNKAAYQGMSVLDIARKENLFKGMGLTIMRNSIGSFALFAVPELLKTEVMGYDTDSKVPLLSNIALKGAGAIASIVIASPPDVVRTRVLSEKAKVSSVRLGFNMFVNEGVGAFFKGSLMKVIMQGPKLAFAMCITDGIVDYLKERREKNEQSSSARLR